MKYPGKLHYVQSAYAVCYDVLRFLKQFHPTSKCIPAATALVTSFASHVRSYPNVDFHYPVAAVPPILRKTITFSNDTEGGEFGPPSSTSLAREAAIEGDSLRPSAHMLDDGGPGPGPGPGHPPSQQANTIAFGEYAMQAVNPILASPAKMRPVPGPLQAPSGSDGKSSDDETHVFFAD